MSEAHLSIGQALDLGVKFALAGNSAQAAEIFRGVLIHEPQNFEAIERLGASLFDLGQYHEALYWFWRARKINRRHPLALMHYALTLSQLGHPDEALDDLERAAAIADKTAPAHIKALVFNNLGNVLERLARHKEAIVALDKSIANDPRDPFPHYNRGISLLRLNRHEEALTALDHCLDLAAVAKDAANRTNPADVKYNRGMARLLLGDLKGGFEDYENRLLTSENERPNLGFPADKKWEGQPIEDRRLLILGEQGIGDSIQFLRFVPLVRKRGAHVTLAVQTALQPLLSWPDVTVIPGTTVVENDSYDYWVPLMSLPHRLGVAHEAQIPEPWFIRTDPERVNEWAAKLPPDFGRTLRVGICWAGNFRHKNDAHRSIPLGQFASLFDIDADFVSVQQMREEEREEFAALQSTHKNLTAFYLDDFRDTAAVILNCDVMLSADTSVAHLSASLGVRTWIFVPAYSTDWRWQRQRTDSPWYPAATLLRQDRVGDWRGTLARVKDQLAALATARMARAA